MVTIRQPRFSTLDSVNLFRGLCCWSRPEDRQQLASLRGIHRPQWKKPSSPDIMSVTTQERPIESETWACIYSSIGVPDRMLVLNRQFFDSFQAMAALSTLRLLLLGACRDRTALQPLSYVRHAVPRTLSVHDTELDGVNLVTEL